MVVIVVDGAAVDDGFDEAVLGVPGEGGVGGDGHAGTEAVDSGDGTGFHVAVGIVDGLEGGGAGVVDSGVLVEDVASDCGAAGIGEVFGGSAGVIGGAETVPDAIEAVGALEGGAAGAGGGDEFAALVVAPVERGGGSEGAAGGCEAFALTDGVDGVAELGKGAAGDVVLPDGEDVAGAFVGESGIDLRADEGEGHVGFDSLAGREDAQMDGAAGGVAVAVGEGVGGVGDGLEASGIVITPGGAAVGEGVAVGVAREGVVGAVFIGVGDGLVEGVDLLDLGEALEVAGAVGVLGMEDAATGDGA